MELGAFSVSLAVKDIEASRDFYEKFGFQVVGGDSSQNWLILRNSSHTIGLFQGMLEKNILTFNPGWDAEAQPIDSFTDIRELQRELKSKGRRTGQRGGRRKQRSCQLCGGRPRRQPNPRGPARVTVLGSPTRRVSARSIRNDGLLWLATSTS